MDDAWVLQPSGRDLFDVLRNGRRLRSDLTESAARRWIRSRMHGGDKVSIEEPDGYRQKLKTV
jgi:hypothetical protein